MRGSKNIRRGISASVAAIASAVALSACFGGDDGGGSAERPEGDTLRIAVEQAPDPLDPATLSDNRSIELAQNVYRGLADVDQEAQVVPGLATWESDDGKVYTFKLEPGNTFQSGEPITAEAIAFSLNRVLDPEIGSGYTFFLSLIEGADAVTKGKAKTAKGIEVVDERTLRITLTQPAAYFPAIASRWPYWAVDPKVVEEGGEQWVKPGNLGGSGPYRLTKATGDTEFGFAAADYGGPAPKIKKVNVSVVPEPATRVARYKAGEFDAVFNLSAAALAQAKRDPELEDQLGTISLLRTTWLSMDNSRPPFDDERVRQAFNYAIDRDAVVRVPLGGLGEPARTFVPPGTPLIEQPSETPPWYSFDPEEGKRLLAEAGYPDGEGFPKLDIVLGDRSEEQAVAQYLQAQLKENLGVEVGVKTMPQTAYNDLINDPATLPKLLIYSFGLDYPDPQEMLEFFGTSEGFVNYERFSDKRFDELITKGNTSLDSAERTQAYSEAQEVFLDAAAVAPLYYGVAAWLAKPYLRGVGANRFYMNKWIDASFAPEG